MKLAPIALFAYNRPEHLKKTVDALRKNIFASESELFVFSDGTRSELDQSKIVLVRSYAKTITGFKSLEVIERPKNLGLANSIIAGVGDILKRYETVIVLEDDLLTSPHFLTYLNDGLRMYENDQDVISLHSYVYPVKGKLPETFFIRGADCLGWATWRRGWRLFEADGKKLLRELEGKKLIRAFDFDNTFHFTQMLRDQIVGKNSSWAIRWYASAFLNKKITLYPGRSLIYHFGNDGTGTHSAITTVFDSALTQSSIKVNRIPVKENAEAFKQFKRFFRSLMPPFWRRVVNKLYREFKRYV